MAHFSMRLAMVAATVVVAAGVAPAQGMRAEIPFTFRAGKQVMAAGTYRITTLTRKSGLPVFRIADEDSRVAILTVPLTAADARKAWQSAGDPLLAFECTDGRCALTNLWNGGKSQAYVLYRPKAAKDEPVQFVSVAIRPEKAE